MNQQRAEKVLRKISEQIGKQLEEETEAFLKAYKEGLLEWEGTGAFKFNIGMKAIITAEGSAHNIKTRISWSARHAADAMFLVEDTGDLLDQLELEEDEGEEEEDHAT